jgi:hypothetical protein
MYRITNHLSKLIKRAIINKASCGTRQRTQHEARVARNPDPRLAKQAASYAF